MPLIDDRSRQILSQKFGDELQDDVDIKIFTRRINLVDTNSEFNDFTIKLIHEMAEINPHIKPSELSILDDLAQKYGLKTSPSVMIGEDKGYRIIFNGAPLGHEFTSFVETISMVSRDNPGLSTNNVELMKNVDKETRVQVFVTPSCPNCPRSVIQANGMAIAAKGLLTSETVEAQENLELATKFNVSAVPQQIVNGDADSISIGVQNEPGFIDQVLKYAASRYGAIKSEMEAKEKAEAILADEPDHPVKLTDSNFDEALKKYPKIMVDFWAEWCGPCRMVTPIIEELAGTYKGKVVFGKLNSDDNPVIARKFNVMSIPTVIVFKDGQVAEELVGAMPRGAYMAAVQKHFNA